MRAHNTSAVLDLAWAAGEISRVDLVRQSGLAPSTVSGIVAGLIDQELVRESHVARSSGGRPPIMLRFRYDRYQLLGVDLGATHVSVALTDLSGRVLAWRSQDHPVQADPEGTLARVLAGVSAVLAEAGIGLEHVVGLGLGVPSPVQAASNELSERILPAWAGIRPAEWLAERLGLPSFVANDANLGALAETWLGAGRDADTLAFVKVGTGVGAGLIIGREIFRGANGIAGEIGHTAIDSSGPPCACGLNGCLQAMIGSAAIIERVRDRLSAGSDSTLTAADLSLGAVANAACEGDRVAREAVEEAGQYLGIAVANLINLLNPNRVVVGGSLTAAGELLLAPLRESIRSRALWASLAHAGVTLSELGDRNIALGGAILVLRAAIADPAMFTTRAVTATAPHGPSRPARTLETT